MTIKETVLDIIDTVRNRNDTCQYTASLIEGFVKLIDDESFPVSDGWISVTDRLPKEENVPVWVGSSLLGTRSIAFRQDGEWYADVGYDLDKEGVAAITHWQPLPNPPTSHK